MVPQVCDIDISKYVRAPPNQSACITPSTHNRYVKKPASVRRKKNPVVLNLDKISMSLSDDEESNVSSSTVAHSTRKLELVKLVKRKILEEDLVDDSITWKESVPIDTKSINCKIRNNSNTQTHERSIEDTRKVTFSCVGPNLMNLVDEDIPVATGNLDKLIEEVDKLKVNPDATQKTRRVKGTSQRTIANYNKNANRAKALKDMVINEETNVNVHSKMEVLNTVPIQNEKTSEEYDRKSSTTAVKTSKQSTDNKSISSISQSKTAQCRSSKLLNNEVTGVKTRSSLRKTKEKPL